MAVGTSPDAYRDYNLDKLLPETIAAMGEQADRLRQASARMVKLTGSRGSNTAVLDRIVTQLTDMSERPIPLQAVQRLQGQPGFSGHLAADGERAGAGY